MAINRHNYQEFFLLYVDKELDADEQAAVENFIRQNPDLAKELEMFARATLVEDPIKFEQKELLYRKEEGISLHNYEEYFLLYADNELNGQERMETDHFVLKHPQLQNEFTLLQQTKLEVEMIKFDGKEKLYRQERKIRRIIPMVMVRVGAAAAIVGIVYMSFTMFSSNSTDGNIVIATTEPAKKLQKDNDGSTDSSDKANSIALPDIKKKSKINLEKDELVSGKYKREKSKEIKTNKKEFLAASKKGLKNETQASDKNIEIAKSTIHEQVYSATEKIGTKPFGDNNKIMQDQDNAETATKMVKQTVVEEQPALAVHAVYLETDNEEEGKSIYIGSAEINKNKLKGLLKKAGGFLNKKIRQSDD